MAMGVHICKAGVADAAVLADMNWRLIEDEGHTNPMNIQQLTDRMLQWLLGEFSAYIAFEESVPVAYCIYRDEGDFFYLRQLYVERGHRREGLATELLDWMFANVWKDRRVRLEVLANNAHAIRFYENYGFVIGCHRMEMQSKSQGP